MHVAIITIGVIALSLIIGIILASLLARFSQAVITTQSGLEQEKVGFNPGLTYGHKILVQADAATQLKQARQLAAKTAARLPRGANQRIGRKGAENLKPASQTMEQDPMTAAHIAAFHGWRTVTATARPTAAATRTPAVAKAAPTPVAAKLKTADDLIPGQDYPYIEITEAMSPADRRKATIANAKAKAAAAKALKESGAVVAVPAGDGTSVAEVVETTVEMVVAAPAGDVMATGPAAGEEANLVAGRDYPYIEITPDMPPADRRKATIANAKARSAAAKARKSAGE